RDVVVRPRLEAEDAVDLGVHRGQHEDREVALATQAPADLDPGKPGQADVEDEDVVARRPRRLERALAVGELVDLEACRTQRVADGVDDRLLVVDDEDTFSHAVTSRPARSFMRTIVPRPRAESISSSLPIAFAAAATIARPSPKPPFASLSPR